MNIIVEGVDNSGKSTLIERVLMPLLSLTVQRSEGPPKYPGEMNDRVKRYLTYDGVIFDRHPCVSQMIYGAMRDNIDLEMSLAADFYASQPLLIYCDPGNRRLGDHRRNPVDTDQHLEQIERGYPFLLTTYRDWAMRYAHFMYRIGDDPTYLIRAVRGVYHEH